VLAVGKMLFTSSIDATIRCWQLGSGKTDHLSPEPTVTHKQVTRHGTGTLIHYDHTVAQH
jgi:hypothetical protein